MLILAQVGKFLKMNIFSNTVFCLLDEHGVARRLWQLIDRVIQQIAVQEDDGSDPDVAPLDINVNYILDTLVVQSLLH